MAGRARGPRGLARQDDALPRVKSGDRSGEVAALTDIFGGLSLRDQSNPENLTIQTTETAMESDKLALGTVVADRSNPPAGAPIDDHSFTERTAKDSNNPLVKTVEQMDNLHVITKTAKNKEYPQVKTPEEKEKPQVKTAKEKGTPQVKTAKEMENPQVKTAKEKETPQVKTAKDKENPQVKTAKEKENPQVKTAKEKENPQVKTPKERNDSCVQTSGINLPKSRMLADSTDKAGEDDNTHTSGVAQIDEDLIKDDTDWKIIFQLMGDVDNIEVKDLCACLTQIMPGQVKMTQSSPTSRNDMTFLVHSQSLDINWQEVVQKLGCDNVKSRIGRVELFPLTDFVIVMWLTDKCSFEYLELYLSHRKKTGLPDDSSIKIVKFRRDVKEAMVKVAGTTAADISRMCSRNHFLDEQPVSINPWFGSVNDFMMRHGQTVTSHDADIRVTEEYQQGDDGSSVDPVVSEWKSSIAVSDIPVYRLILKRYELIPDNVCIDLDQKHVMVYGSLKEIQTAKFQLHEVVRHIKGLHQRCALSPSVVNVLKRAGGEAFLSQVLAEEDIPAVVVLTCSPGWLEVYVSNDWAEGEMALTHILYRMLVKERFILDGYPPQELREQIQQMCDNYNVALDIYNNKGTCNINLHGFRKDIHKAVEHLESTIGPVDFAQMRSAFDKVTGSYVFTGGSDRTSFVDLANAPSNSVQSPQSHNKNQRALTHSQGNRLQSQRKESYSPKHRSTRQYHRSSSYQFQDVAHAQVSTNLFRDQSVAGPPGFSSDSPKPDSKDFGVVRHEGPEPKPSLEVCKFTENSLSSSKLRYIQKHIQKTLQKQLEPENGQLNIDLVKNVLEVTYPKSCEHLVVEIRKVRDGLITQKQRIDVPGIYQYLTDTPKGRGTVDELEDKYSCIIDINKLRLPGAQLDTPADETAPEGAAATPVLRSQKSTSQKSDQEHKSKPKRFSSSVKKIIKKLRPGKKEHRKEEEEYRFGDLRVVIKQEDITKSGATILVNVVDPKPNTYKGPSKVFGDSGRYNSIRWALQKYESAAIGEVIVTKSYGIARSSYIYHAVLPRHYSPEVKWCVGNAIMQVLLTANIYNTDSVAFPALGCGGRKFEPSEVAEDFINCLCEFVTNGGVHVTIKEVTLCIWKKDVCQKFMDCFDAAAENMESLFAAEAEDKTSSGGHNNEGNPRDHVNSETAPTKRSDGAMCDIVMLDGRELNSVRKGLDEVAKRFETETKAVEVKRKAHGEEE